MKETQALTETQDERDYLYELMERIYAPNNRCGSTITSVITRAKQSIRKDMVMVEGKVDGNYHVWLEYKGKIYDCHFEIQGIKLGYEYIVEKRHTSEAVVEALRVSKEDPDNYEIKEAYKMNGAFRFSHKVWYIEPK